MLRLIAQLENHTASDEREDEDRAAIAQLLSVHGSAALYRNYFSPGHVTASALLISADGERVLMNHHKSLNKWLCFGGHADGDVVLLNAARREVIEESGIQDIEPVFDHLIDVDVHPIPANEKKSEPAHAHYDVRFIFRATGSEEYMLSHESTALRWCDINEARALIAPYAQSRMVRLLDKWQAWQRKQAA